MSLLKALGGPEHSTGGLREDFCSSITFIPIYCFGKLNYNVLYRNHRACKIRKTIKIKEIDINV